jgi:hypothetical protein
MEKQTKKKQAKEIGMDDVSKLFAKETNRSMIN